MFKESGLCIVFALGISVTVASCHFIALLCDPASGHAMKRVEDILISMSILVAFADGCSACAVHKLVCASGCAMKSHISDFDHFAALLDASCHINTKFRAQRHFVSFSGDLINQQVLFQKKFLRSQSDSKVLWTADICHLRTSED